MADPWSAGESSLGWLERNFRHARMLIDQLAVASPDNLNYAQGQVHVHAKLAVTLQRLGRLDEAEAAYRETIVTEGKHIERWPRNGRLRMDRTTTRAALAMLQRDRGRSDDADPDRSGRRRAASHRQRRADARTFARPLPEFGPSVPETRRNGPRRSDGPPSPRSRPTSSRSPIPLPGPRARTAPKVTMSPFRDPLDSLLVRTLHENSRVGFSRERASYPGGSAKYHPGESYRGTQPRGLP